MTNAESLPPAVAVETIAVDSKEEFQADADRLLSERAGLILPTRLGRFVVGPRDLTDRTANDVTNVDQHLIPASPDTNRTQIVLERHRKLASNFSEVAEMMDETITKHRLTDYPQLMIATPHTTMFDILGACYNSFFTETLCEGRNPSDNYMYLSRMLGYAAYRSMPAFTSELIEQKAAPLLDRIPFEAAVKTKQKLHDKYPSIAPQTVVDAYISPVTNIIQVFPPTSSLEPLREKHGLAMDRANMNANRTANRDQQQKENAPQQVIWLAPPGSQMKKYKDGKKQEPIHPTTIKMMYKSYRNNTPVQALGYELDLLQATLNIPSITLGKMGIKLHRQKVRFAAGMPILPEENLSREEFEIRLKEVSLSVARAVSKKPIYA